MKQIFAVLMLLSVFATFESQAQTLKPGFWKAKVNFKVNGLPLPASDEEDCILPSEVKDVKASIVKNLKKNGCELSKWDIKGQNLKSSIVCRSDDLDATGSLNGTVTDTKYSLNGDAKGTYKQMLPATAIISIQGEWVKPCDKAAK